MPQAYEALLALMAEKRDGFLRYEQATEALLSCPSEELEERVRLRDKLIAQIDKLTAAVDAEAAHAADAPDVRAALTGRANRGELGGVLGELYDAAASVRAVVSRIPEIETQVRARLENEQQRLLGLIKAANRGAEARAARFASGQDSGGGFTRHIDA